MKILRCLSLLAIAVMLVLSMTACGEDAAQVETTVTVEAHDYEGSPIVLGDVTFEHETPTVLVALEQMWSDANSAYNPGEVVSSRNAAIFKD